MKNIKPTDKIESINGIGEQTAKRFHKLNIYTVEDLLHHFPFRYEDTSKIIKISKLRSIETHCNASLRELPDIQKTPDTDLITIKAEIISIKNFFTRTRKRLTIAKVADETGELEVMWFNQHFLTKILKNGTQVILSGKLDEKGKKLISPNYEVVSEYKDPTHLARITPIYSETKGLTSKFLRKIFKELDEFAGIEKLIEENLSPKILEKNDLSSRPRVFKILHFPQNQKDLEIARDRMAFEELYEILRKVEIQKKKIKKYSAPQIIPKGDLIEKFLKGLEFEPTKAQKRCIEEICVDIDNTRPMNRLLEGDVGSGKTLVAMAAILNAISNDFQVALLAPTQVLAEQHFKTFQKFLPWLKDELMLITGNTKYKFPPLTRGDKGGLKPKIIIGTHSILHRAKDLFNNLGLVIIDEQHRFGVKQREFLTEFSKQANLLNPSLREVDKVHDAAISDMKDEKRKMKNEMSGASQTKNQKQLSYRAESRDLESQRDSQPLIPHILTMTATPIPRSLALTLFGDLEISVIDELPSGRIPIQTHVVPGEKRQASYEWIRKQVQNGGQTFVICPLVEESEKLEVKSATEEYKRLSGKVFPELKIALLHGRIKPKEKEEILSDFRNKKYDILVSTAVVEVGIDIPDATVMVIEGAERFGLAQLHQFRGRVGRSDKKSYCLLFTESGSEKALERLQFFASTNDGLKIAEYDLHSRGPGEVYGTRQAGIPDLKFANLFDLDLIKKVRKSIEVSS